MPMRIIGLFFPALISISIKHSRNPECTWQMPMLLVEYGIYVLVNVLATTMIITYGLNISDVLVDAFDSFPFFTKYTIIAIIVAVFTPYIQEIAKKYIDITFSVRKKDESMEDHKKGN